MALLSPVALLGAGGKPSTWLPPGKLADLHQYHHSIHEIPLWCDKSRVVFKQQSMRYYHVIPLFSLAFPCFSFVFSCISNSCPHCRCISRIYPPVMLQIRDVECHELLGQPSLVCRVCSTRFLWRSDIRIESTSCLKHALAIDSFAPQRGSSFPGRIITLRAWASKRKQVQLCELLFELKHYTVAALRVTIQ